MNSYSLAHLADGTLLEHLATLVTQVRATTAALLAHLGEVDERQLYRAAAYESMFFYCVHELHMSEDTAVRRIGVARTAREFPAIFPALADGRLNLTAVLLLTPHLTPYLTPETAEELLAAAAHKTKQQIRLLLAERFPKADVPTLVRAIAPTVASDEGGVQPVDAPSLQLAPERVVPSEPLGGASHMEPLAARASVAPLSPGRFALQVTVDQEAYEQLRYVQALLGHAVPSGDVAQVLKQALNSLARELEQKRFARSARYRPSRGSGNVRHVPPQVRRQVWERDGGRCTFTSATGKRCEARTRLEFDHATAVARGGETSVDGLRLLCRAHNQFEAECTFGAGSMREQREEARREGAEAKAHRKARPKAEAAARARAEA